MTMVITPSGSACGAAVAGVDLTAPLSDEDVGAIRAAWLEHHVLAFPDQPMTVSDLERFTLSFGRFGDDPFIAPIAESENVISVSRLAGETSPLFAENWHSDWSFQDVPPAGTCLFGVTIPPTGGDTLFANQHLALERMPESLRVRLNGRVAVHSATTAYSPGGMYGEDDADDRSMDIRPDDSAGATRLHPIIRAHPETGRLGIFSALGYIVGIEGMPDEEARPLLGELYHWQTRPEFVYRHVWQPDMLVMWDNRSVLHRATGGYEGHDRILLRTTIGDRSR